MSSIAVRVVSISDVQPHTNADSLELAIVNGWQMVVRKGIHAVGEKVVYFEQGTVLPREVADRFNATSYLSEKTDMYGNRVLVVHRVKLRGEPSFGLAVVPDNPTWEIGLNVAEQYGATKYYPPVKATAGDAEQDDPRFPTYTDIENMRNYLDVFVPQDTVIVTEKIHGTNCRVGFVQDDTGYTAMAGSRTLRRRQPEYLHTNTYWYPWSLLPVQRLFAALQEHGHQQAVLYGEVFRAISMVRRGSRFGRST